MTLQLASIKRPASQAGAEATCRGGGDTLNIPSAVLQQSKSSVRQGMQYP
ncbi:hypothetical protein DESA109040_18770 [Deinococcus saxicola]